MKKLLVFLLVISAVNNLSFAQKIDITDKSNVWYMLTTQKSPKGSPKTILELYYCRDTTPFVKSGKSYTSFNLCGNNPQMHLLF